MPKQKQISTLAGIIIILVAIAILFGGVFAYKYFATKNSVQVQDQTVGWKTYTNTKYGFEWAPPKSWVKYYAEERTPGEITFGLPLATTLINSDKKLDIWSLKIVPLSQWDGVNCAGQEMCFITEIARNDKFVFATDGPFSFVQSDPCWGPNSEIKNQEKYACAVYKDVDIHNNSGYDFNKSFLLEK